MAGLQNPQQRPSRAPSELHHAAYTGSVKGITAALSRRLTPVDQPGRHGRTALMGAAYKGYSRVMEILLEKGASVKMGDDEGVAALHVAAGEGHVDATKVLVKAGADVEAATLRGDTALHWASDNGHAGVIRALIEAGADPDKRRVDGGSTALYMACRQGFLNAVMELLRSKANPLIVQRMDPSRVQAKDCTPLDAAAANGHSEVVSAMMSVVGIEGYGGACRCVRALGLAAFGDHLTVVRILTDAGVKDTGEALINASMNGRGASVKFLLQQEDGRTRSGGALVNTARDMNGNTPLVLAIVCSESSPGVARLLVDAGADTTSVVRTGTAGRWEGFSGTPMDLVMQRLGNLKRHRSANSEEEAANEKELYRLEAVRRLLLQVEAAHAVSWLWHIDILPADHSPVEREHRAKVAAMPMVVVLPILRRRARRRGVLSAAMGRYSGKT